MEHQIDILKNSNLDICNVTIFGDLTCIRGLKLQLRSSKLCQQYCKQGFCLLICRRWPPYWPTGRLAYNQKLRKLTDNLSKMSNKTFSKDVIGQFKNYFVSGQIYSSFFMN